jgi:hypothetical protein
MRNVAHTVAYYAELACASYSGFTFDSKPDFTNQMIRDLAFGLLIRGRNLQVSTEM